MTDGIGIVFRRHRQKLLQMSSNIPYIAHLTTFSGVATYHIIKREKIVQHKSIITWVQLVDAGSDLQRKLPPDLG